MWSIDAHNKGYVNSYLTRTAMTVSYLCNSLIAFIKADSMGFLTKKRALNRLVGIKNSWKYEKD